MPSYPTNSCPALAETHAQQKGIPHYQSSQMPHYPQQKGILHYQSSQMPHYLEQRGMPHYQSSQMPHYPELRGMPHYQSSHTHYSVLVSSYRPHTELAHADPIQAAKIVTVAILAY